MADAILRLPEGETACQRMEACHAVSNFALVCAEPLGLSSVVGMKQVQLGVMVSRICFMVIGVSTNIMSHTQSTAHPNPTHDTTQYFRNSASSSSFKPPGHHLSYRWLGIQTSYRLFDVCIVFIRQNTVMEFLCSHFTTFETGI